ncbi:MAG: hypothetical protein MJ052_02865, partial [Sphaerochaetaceae bacterium]|nr:hypothetical protein [Sphaerochaetaceae bacterium]
KRILYRKGRFRIHEWNFAIGSISLVFSVLLLCSCGTSVQIKALVPGMINLEGCRTVAVASVKPYDYHRSEFMSGRYGDSRDVPESIRSSSPAFTPFVVDEVAAEMSRSLERALDQGFYTIIGTTQTDSYITDSELLGYSETAMLGKRGADVLITASIDDMFYEEFVDSEEEETPSGYSQMKYSLNQRAEMVLSYKVKNTLTGEEIDFGVLNGTYPFNRYERYYRTHITSLPAEAAWSESSISYLRVKEPVDMFKEIIRSFSEELTARLTPHYETSYLTLMRNRPEVDTLKEAYELVEKGQLQKAYDIFIREWKNSHHFPSGYNAAILEMSLGRYSQAYVLAGEVWSVTGEDSASKLQKHIAETENNRNSALKQMRD